MRIDLGRLPRRTTRQARLAILAAAMVCDEAGDLSFADLHRALGNESRASTYKAIAECHALGYLHRRGHRLILAVAKLDPTRCPECGRPTKDGKTCYDCRTTVMRSDRAWRGAALTAWAAAKASGLTEGQAIYRVQSATKLRLYGTTPAELESGEPHRPALIPWMVEEGMIDPVWITYATRAKGQRPYIRGVVPPEASEDGWEG